MTGPTNQRPTALVLDSLFCGHETPPGHPEQAARITAIQRELEARGLPRRCLAIKPVPAAEQWIELNHDSRYLERLTRACAGGAQVLDSPDCPIESRTDEIARNACGALLALADAVLGGAAKNGFAAVRPPGHHAERDRAMGFCFINNVAVAARYVINKHGIERVCIIDWDVHHGNGTQHSFEEDPTVLYCSIHGHPAVFYPGTGFAHERGKGKGEGTTLNLPLAPGSGDDELMAAWNDALRPTVLSFKPQVILISAGFDGHRDDPIGCLSLSEDIFGRLTGEVAAMASACGGAKVLSVLEGGYNLQALGRCAAIHLESLIAA